jgi:hypothetical protein
MDMLRFWVGEALNLRIMLGLVGVVMLRGGDSAGLMLTVTGLVKGSCFGGTFSGGPIGLSSRFLFRFFSRRPFKTTHFTNVPSTQLQPHLVV